MRWSAAWVVDSVNAADEHPGQVVLSAGLDRVVEIDGLFDDDIVALRGWAAGQPVEVTDRSGRLVDQLIGLGALVAGVDGADVANGSIDVVSEPIAAALAEAIAVRAGATLSGEHADSAGPAADVGGLVVKLRTQQRVAVDHDDDRPVLHVDLRHEHTLVVGPLELPGLSACDACYDTRLARRWPVPELPPRPAVLDQESLIAELVEFHARRFVATGTHLVNATIAHSLLDGTARLDTLLRVPSCTGCGRRRSTIGQVRLPWHDGVRS